MVSRNCFGRYTCQCVEMTPSSKNHKQKKRVKKNKKKQRIIFGNFYVCRKKNWWAFWSVMQSRLFSFPCNFFSSIAALNPIRMPSNAWKRHKYVLVSKNQSPMRKSDLLLYFNNVFPFYIIFLFSHLDEWFGHRVLIYLMHCTLQLQIAHTIFYLCYWFMCKYNFVYNKRIIWKLLYFRIGFIEGVKGLFHIGKLTKLDFDQRIYLLNQNKYDQSEFVIMI